MHDAGGVRPGTPPTREAKAVKDRGNVRRHLTEANFASDMGSIVMEAGATQSRNKLAAVSDIPFAMLKRGPHHSRRAPAQHLAKGTGSHRGLRWRGCGAYDL